MKKTSLNYFIAALLKWYLSKRGLIIAMLYFILIEIDFIHSFILQDPLQLSFMIPLFQEISASKLPMPQ